jgi:S-formylglutathione hydrolase FrmB
MKYFLKFLFLLCCLSGHSQKGKTVTTHFSAPSIRGNTGGESSERRMTIYLPPGYNAGKNRYPVIYYLHGYTFNDSTCAAWLQLQTLMDEAISKGMIRPVIVVVPDSYTTFGGSFYSNSTLTGNWADYIGKDVVSYTDQHFRTIADRNSRGVTGISMGGYGAIKMGMLFPEVFGVVYASTPVMLNWSDALNPSISTFKLISTNDEKAIKGSFSATLMIDLGRSWSPDQANAPYYAAFPATYIKDSMVLHMDIVKKWSANLPTLMIEDHLTALKSLHALKLDWGRNDEGRHNLALCLEFSKKLERYGVNHFAEEYLGGHADMLPGIHGRVYTEVLPFFESYLKF